MNDIDIYNEYKNVRKNMEEIEFIWDTFTEDQQ